MRKKMFSDDYEIFDMYLLTPQAMLQFKYNVGVCGIPIQFFILVNHISVHPFAKQHHDEPYPSELSFDF